MAEITTRSEINERIYNALLTRGGENEYNREFKIPQIMADFNASLDKLIELNDKSDHSTIADLASDPRDVADACIASEVVYSVGLITDGFDGPSMAENLERLGVDSLYTDIQDNKDSDIVKDNDHLGDHMLDRIEPFYTSFSNDMCDSQNVESYATYYLDDEKISVDIDKLESMTEAEKDELCPETLLLLL